jgi:2-succinyl-5-enolpyruvyl-6-hydroxy-3-cyclohexene-1-carboxylate synthase
LLAAHRHGLAATVVALDNDGGGIFSFLPIAEHADAVDFEANFRTPHGLDLGPVAEAFGARATRVGSWEEFNKALAGSIGTPGVDVIIVPIERDASVAHHRAIEAAVSAAVSGLAGASGNGGGKR